MSKVIRTLGIIAALAGFTYIFATPAFAATFTVWERYGTQAVGAPNLGSGQNMVEVAHPGRTLTWSNDAPNYLGDSAGHLQVSGGNYIRASDDCSTVYLTTSSSANGTVWAQHFSNGSLYLINRRCDQQYSSPDTMALAGRNVNGDVFSICGSPLDCTGWFRAMTFGS
jgi:hypothetical protein